MVERRRRYRYKRDKWKGRKGLRYKVEKEIISV
jgi:hypothetical protein